jgi:AAA family ATP:ADP antiporter
MASRAQRGGTALVSRLGIFVDIRGGEWGVGAGVFLTLLVAISAHAMLETARDALFLAKLAARDLNVVYFAIAGAAMVTAPVGSVVSRAFGVRAAFAATALVAAAAAAALFVLRAHSWAIAALYVFSGVLGAALVPQFWALAAATFTVAQGRRLFARFASAGVLGGVVGSGLAGLLARWIAPASLLLVAAGLLVVSAVISLLAPRGSAEAAEQASHAPVNGSAKEPFVARIGWLVGLSTAALLAGDYLFKATVARSMPASSLAAFFGWYYAALNAASLAVQLGVANAVVRRVGVGGAIAVVPALFALGGAGAAFTGARAAFVIAAKTLDGSLRHSLHRLTVELLYLPVPPLARARAKPLIDGAVARGAQAITALLLYAITAAGAGNAVIAWVVVALALAWLGAALSMRGPYLGLFRKALTAGTLDRNSHEPAQIDLGSAELLVERLASTEPAQVLAAVDVLARHGRDRLIPALILFHQDERVLARALDVFAASTRTDWTPLARALVTAGAEPVRIAALRALATHGASDALEMVGGDASPRVQGYALVASAIARGRHVEVDLSLAGEMPDDTAAATKEGLLAAATDLGPAPKLRALLLAFAKDTATLGSPVLSGLFASAIAKSGDASLVEHLVPLLGRTHARDAARAALARLGDVGFGAVAAALADPATPRRLRVHLPRTLPRFRTQRAAALLLELLEKDPDGLVRYKALRGLGTMAAEGRVGVDRRRIGALARKNLLENVRVAALRAVLDEGHGHATAILLRSILDDKARQALERAFRLLKIAHPKEDLHAAHRAAVTGDKRARGNAAEFLDALLAGRDQEPLRAVLRVVVDDLSPLERAVRTLATSPPDDETKAVRALVADADRVVALLASVYEERLARG